MVFFYSKNAEKKIEEINSDWKITYTNNLQPLLNKLKEYSVLCLDTETTGLSPIKDNITMVQFGNENDQYIIDVRDLDLSILKPIFNTNTLFIGHNIKFDYNMLKKHGIILQNIYDTMLCEMVIQNGKYSMLQIMATSPNSLKSLTKKYLGIDIGKETREEFIYWGNKPFTSEQILYGAKDVKYPIEIRKQQLKYIKHYKLESTVNLEHEASLALGDIEYNGFKLDSTKWLKANKEFIEKLKNTLVKLDNILIEKETRYEIKSYQLELFSNVSEDTSRRLTNVNWDSPLQVLKILTEVFNIFPKDKDGKLSSGSKALLLLDDKPPIVKTLLAFRKESKAISSFGAEFLTKFLHEDSRIRTTFNSIVETGRVSSRKPNMQQIPRDVNFRSCFIPSSDKHILITADYSNQEGRIMADMSNDANYIDFFNNGDGDAHSFIARTLFSAAEGRPVDVRNDENHPNYALRQKGKVLNFFISFGGSAHTLSGALKIPLEEAQYLIDNFYKGFPGLKKMFDYNSQYALNTGYIRTNPVTNRIRWMRGWNKYQELLQKNKSTLTKEEFKTMSMLKGKIRRRGMNTPIQGQWPCLNRVNSGKAEMLILSQAS